MTWSSIDVSPLHLRVVAMLTARALVISIDGEVDVSNADELGRVLSRISFEEAESVTVDLRGLTFSDSAGCHELARLERAVRRTGRRTAILGASPVIAKVMTVLWPDVAQVLASSGMT